VSRNFYLLIYGKDDILIIGRDDYMKENPYYVDPYGSYWTSKEDYLASLPEEARGIAEFAPQYTAPDGTIFARKEDCERYASAEPQIGQERVETVPVMEDNTEHQVGVYPDTPIVEEETTVKCR